MDSITVTQFGPYPAAVHLKAFRQLKGLNNNSGVWLMKLLGLMYFNHVVCSFCHPPITAADGMGKNEKITSGSSYFPSKIVLTLDSLEGYVSLWPCTLSQMNGDTLVIAQGREGKRQRGNGALPQALTPSTITTGAQGDER